MRRHRGLSIDGGGQRGIVPAEGLHLLGLNHEDFDWMVGNSAGGIIVLALAAGYEPSEIVGLFRENGPEIFDGRMWEHGLLWSKHSAHGVNGVLQRKFSDMRMRDLKVPATVCTWNHTLSRAVFISSETHPDWLVWEAARCTSAAPSYFPPHAVHEEYFGTSNYWDGGVFCNSPVIEAYTQGREGFATDFELLALGTGYASRPLKHPRSSGLLGVAGDVVNALMDGGMQTAHDWAARLARLDGVTFRCYNDALPAYVQPQMDICTPEQNMALLQFARDLYGHQDQ